MQEEEEGQKLQAVGEEEEEDISPPPPPPKRPTHKKVASGARYWRLNRANRNPTIPPSNYNGAERCAEVAQLLFNNTHNQVGQHHNLFGLSIEVAAEIPLTPEQTNAAIAATNAEVALTTQRILRSRKKSIADLIKPGALMRMGVYRNFLPV